ncbi:hypothetical protein TrVE_jg6913 [Triparma verrucosa]|uniref:WW domain-containing protein n=1 Tax=Triparma verrucosa TaxID=1606542 RepID=A0A9W7BID8_9STRA|nr:hypothetical protein TrVE_jg6913 [Triparma verrucosa]
MSAWEKRFDEGSGNHYYYNTETDESSWEVPPDFVDDDASNDSSENNSSDGEDELQDGWEERLDEGSGATYYFNTETEESVWEKPVKPKTQEAAPAAAAHNWEERLDEGSGATYYFNTETEESVWERPPEMDAAADPMPEPQTPQGAPQHNWEERLDESSGATYYFNTETEESVWERPPEMDAAPFFDDNAVSTPPMEGEGGGGGEDIVDDPEPYNPWDQRFDDASGQYYYFNEESEESVWEEPPEFTAHAAWEVSVQENADRREAAKNAGGPTSVGEDIVDDPEPHNPWDQRLDDASGQYYYFNEESEESVWEEPPEFTAHAAWEASVQENVEKREAAKKTAEASKLEEAETPPARPSMLSVLGGGALKKAAASVLGEQGDDSGPATPTNGRKDSDEEEQHTPETDVSKHTDTSAHTEEDDESEEEHSEEEEEEDFSKVKRPREHLQFAPFGMFASVKVDSRPWARKWISIRHSSQTNTYEVTFTASPESEVELSVVDFEKLAFDLMSVTTLVKSTTKPTVQIQRAEVDGDKEPLAILFPSQSEVENFVDAVEVRNKTSTPYHELAVGVGDVLDLTDNDIKALQVVTAEELLAEEDALHKYSEELHSILSNMKNISRQNKAVAHTAKAKSSKPLDDSDDSDEDYHNEDDDEDDDDAGSRRYPNKLKETGQALVLINHEWQQIHLVVDFEHAELKFFTHADAKRPKLRLPLTNCSISLVANEDTKYSKSLKNPLSFQLTVDKQMFSSMSPLSPNKSPSKSGLGSLSPKQLMDENVYAFRTFTLLQLWEWTVTLASLGKIDKDNETIASSKRFSWSVQDLNALENSLADIVTKKLCLASEYEVTYHNPLAFGRPEDVLIDKGGLSVIQTNDHKSFGVPIGSVLTAVKKEGEAEYTPVLGLNYGQTVEFLDQLPKAKPLRVKYRLPCISRVGASVREGADGEWMDCIVKMNDMKMTFEHDKPVLEEVNMISGGDAILTLTADSKYPLLLVVKSDRREVAVRFTSFKKLLEFNVGFLYSTMLVGCGSNEKLLNALDGSKGAGVWGESDSDVDDEEAGDVSMGGWMTDEADTPAKIDGSSRQGGQGQVEGGSGGQVKQADTGNTYEIVDQLQTHLTDLEEPLPATEELIALRRSLAEKHKKNIESLVKRVEADAEDRRILDEEAEAKMVAQAKNEERGGGGRSAWADEKKMSMSEVRYGGSGSERQRKGSKSNRGVGAGAGAGGGDSPLKQWNPTLGYSHTLSLSSHLPSLTEIMDSSMSPLLTGPAGGSRDLGGPGGSKNSPHSPPSPRSPRGKRRRHTNQDDVSPLGAGAANEEKGGTSSFQVSQPSTTPAVKSDEKMTLLGTFLGEVMASPEAVVASAVSLAGNGMLCRKFCRAVVQRLGSRYLTVPEEFLVPLVRFAVKTRNQVVVNSVVAEICCLPEVFLFGKSVARVDRELELGAGGDDDEDEGLTPEATALSMVRKIIGSLSSFGADNFPSSLVSCLQAVSSEVNSVLSAESILSEFILLKALKDAGVVTGRGGLVERFLITFLRTAAGGIGGRGNSNMTIRLRAQTAGLQVQFSKTLSDVLSVRVGGARPPVGQGLNFESSFAGGSGAKPKEMLGSIVVTGEDIYLIHSGVEEGLRGGGHGAYSKLATSLVALGGVDLGWTSVRDRDKAFVLKLQDGNGGGDVGGGASDEVAIQEARWLLSKAKASLQGLFSERGLQTAGVLESAKDVLRELESKKSAIKLIAQEARRLGVALELCENYAAGLSTLGDISEGGGGEGGAKFMLETKLERIVAIEREFISRAGARGAGLGGSGGVGLEAAGGGRGGGAGAASIAASANFIPSSPLATLLSTVFSPMNLGGESARGGVGGGGGFQ